MQQELGNVLWQNDLKYWAKIMFLHVKAGKGHTVLIGNSQNIGIKTKPIMIPADSAEYMSAYWAT